MIRDMGVLVAQLFMLIRMNAFSAAIAFNMFSMTLYLVSLSLVGNSEMAADVGVVQGALLAAFMAFSANARNRILTSDNGDELKEQFIFRVLLMLPLSLGAFFLSSTITKVNGLIIVLLVMRRCAEWLAELHISEREKSGDLPYAFRFIFWQLFSLIFLISSLGFGYEKLFIWVLGFWAVTPVLQSFPFFYKMRNAKVRLAVRDFLPHLGSSWAIAISTYVFRVLIVLLAGRAVGGMLFSAYAIGGMLNALYTYALGPSLALITDKRTQIKVERLTAWTVGTLIAAGSSLLILSGYGFGVWRVGELLPVAIGFSLIGGGIMIVAQKKRITMLQVEKRNVFVPDVLANILLISTVPFLFYLLGELGLTALFLWSAVLNGIFYYLAADSFRRPLLEGIQKMMGFMHLPADWQGIQAGIMLLFFFPIFFQLSGRLFQSTDWVFDSHNQLLLLPLPLAVPVCFTALWLLIRDEVVGRSVTILFLTFILMLFSTFLVSDDLDSHLLGKIILICQVILPWFALPLGRSYLEPKRWRFSLEGVFLLVLWMIVPLELLSTWLQGTGFLTPSLYLFSIYQHLQYVPVLFVGFFFLAIAALVDRRESHLWLLGLAPFMGCYAAASTSTLAMLLTVTGCLLLLLARWGDKRFSFGLTALCLCGMIGYGWLLRDNAFVMHKFQYIVQADKEGAVVNIQERYTYWSMYLEGMLKDFRTFLFGHEQRFPRDIAPSAHNYYLDMGYNFGMVTLLPLFYLIFHTCWKFLHCLRAKALSLPLVAHFLLLLFFVLVDNSLKVGLRQPYPGLITFFLWGVLLARLDRRSMSPFVASPDVTYRRKGA